MPDRTPPLVKTTTSTTGTATYVISTTALSSSHRTASQAVIDGDLFDGDTVFYVCRDTTLGNDDKFVEWGVGTYDDGANTVTRDIIIAGSEGPGNPVSWGLSGTRDFYLTTVPDPARLDSANVFTKSQSVVHPGIVSLVLESTGNTATQFRLVTNSQNRRLIALNEALVTMSEIILNDDEIVLSGLVGGDPFLVLNGSTCVFKTGAVVIESLESADGNPYEHFESTANPGAGVPTRLVFHQATAPLGWTQDTSNTEAALRVVSGAGGASGGSIALTGSSVSGSTTITIGTMPAHTHGPGGSATSFRTVQGAGGSAESFGAGGATFGADTPTASTGGGSSHNHSISLKFEDVILAEKD